MIKKVFIISIFLFICRFTCASSVLVLADIHFNPYSECEAANTAEACTSLQQLIIEPIASWPQILTHESINGFKQETNNAFLTDGLDNLIPIANAEQVSRVFIMGDLLCHDFGEMYEKYAPSQYNNQAGLTAFSLKTAEYVLQQIYERLPGSKIYLTLGNNDTDEGDYSLPSPQFLQQLGAYLSEYVSNPTKFINSFSEGGYFSTPLSKNLILVSLNINLLSALQPNETVAEEQLDWLKRTLAQAMVFHQHVIIIQHIPYGMDLYKTATAGSATPLLDPALQAEYLEVLQRYASIITTLYTGHFHMDYFSLVNGVTPLIGNIGFSTIFGNNPGFKLINLDQNGAFAGYTTYVATLAGGEVQWYPLYSFSQFYGAPSNITETLSQFPQHIGNQQVSVYRRFFNGNNAQYLQPISQDNNWKYYYCGIQYLTESDYTQCIKIFGMPVPPALY